MALAAVSANEDLVHIAGSRGGSGYGQDMSGFGQSYSDLSQQPPSYTTATTAPASAGPPAGGSGLGRGQNHNVQGFHPYRR